MPLQLRRHRILLLLRAILPQSLRYYSNQWIPEDHARIATGPLTANPSCRVTRPRQFVPSSRPCRPTAAAGEGEARRGTAFRFVT